MTFLKMECKYQINKSMEFFERNTFILYKPTVN